MKKLILLLVSVTITLSTFCQNDGTKLDSIIKFGAESVGVTKTESNETQTYYTGGVVIDHEKKITMVYHAYDNSSFKECKKFLKSKGNVRKSPNGLYVLGDSLLWELVVVNETLMISAQEWNN